MRTDSNWIQTYTGRQFWPTDPRPEDVCIEDIAHALSLTCRYAGHCNGFYSVAQHAVLVSENCPDPKWGLMHDAAEGYLSDISSPVKREMGPFIDIEDRLLEVIANKYGLQMPIPHCVHEADLRMMVTEKQDLMCKEPKPWFFAQGVVPFNFEVEPWGWELSKYKFLNRFYELF